LEKREAGEKSLLTKQNRAPGFELVAVLGRDNGLSYE